MSIINLPFLQHVKWHPDAKELRKFAVSMLVGFAVLGLLSAWRSGSVGTFSIVLWSIGIVLAVASFIPELARAAYLGVYLPTSVIGYIMSHVVLALTFFLVFTPLGIVLRLTGKDLLQLNPSRDETKWRRVEGREDDDRYYRQF
ncbi:MAG TPA: SxtJ family membrane protein [Pyrinomonadaceae bacterium]|nr:SxtJ family membrane protein [Pyrinomonadaceae bacterium]